MGAATCLLVAGTLAMTLVSGLIAFNGWPGLDVQDVGEQAALVAQVRTGTGTVVTAAPLRMRPPAPAPRVTPLRARRPAVVTSSGPTSQRAAAPARRRPFNDDPRPRPRKPPVKDPQPSPPEVPAAASAPGEPVRDLGKALDTTVDSTGKVVAGLLTPTAPVLGTAVQNTTDVAGDVLGQVVGVVGTIVDGLGRPPAGAP